MTDEAKLRQQVDRGERAKRVLENELVIEAFEKLEQTIVDSWKGSRADEEKQRDNAYVMYRLLQNFKQQFKAAITNGEVARKELLRIQDESKLKRVIHGRR